MDMNLLRNKLTFWIVAIVGTLALVITMLSYTLLDKSDPYQYALNIYYWTHLWGMMLAFVTMVIYTLNFKTNFLSYMVSMLFFNLFVFQIYHIFFGLVGDNEVKRTLLRVCGLVLAIIWVQIAKRIREKV